MQKAAFPYDLQPKGLPSFIATIDWATISRKLPLGMESIIEVHRDGDETTAHTLDSLSLEYSDEGIKIDRIAGRFPLLFFPKEPHAAESDQRPDWGKAWQSDLESRGS
jgi:hypothetical protein